MVANGGKQSIVGILGLNTARTVMEGCKQGLEAFSGMFKGKQNSEKEGEIVRERKRTRGEAEVDGVDGEGVSSVGAGAGGGSVKSIVHKSGEKNLRPPPRTISAEAFRQFFASKAARTARECPPGEKNAAEMQWAADGKSRIPCGRSRVSGSDCGSRSGITVNEVVGAMDELRQHTAKKLAEKGGRAVHELGMAPMNTCQLCPGCVSKALHR